MTWGCSSYISGSDDQCLRCKHEGECRAAIRHGSPVKCEDSSMSAPPRKSSYRPLWLAAVTTGEEFTIRQLSERAPASLESTRQWVIRQMRKGNVEVIGITERRGLGGQHPCLFRYVAGSLDAVTGVQNTIPRDTLDKVAAPIEVTT